MKVYKKRFLIVVICIILFVIIVLLFDKNNNYLNEGKYAKENLAENVTMEIMDDTLTNTGTKVIITDLSNNYNTYGKDYSIERYENNKWVELKKLENNVVTTMEGYEVNEDNILIMEINWEKIYGTLTSRYRLIKTVRNSFSDKKYILVEFNL